MRKRPKSLEQQPAADLLPTLKLKIMADYDCWPLWEGSDVGNVEPECLPLTTNSRARLAAWQAELDESLDRDDPGHSAGVADPSAHDATGRSLVEAQEPITPATASLRIR